MRLRYTAPAARDLERILDGLAQSSPQGAAHVQARIKAVTELLPRFPRIGRATARPGMRRINVAPFPYLVFYRADDHEIVVHAVRHGAHDPATMP